MLYNLNPFIKSNSALPSFYVKDERNGSSHSWEDWVWLQRSLNPLSLFNISISAGRFETINRYLSYFQLEEIKMNKDSFDELVRVVLHQAEWYRTL